MKKADKKSSGGCAYKKGGKVKKPVKVDGKAPKERLDKFARGGGVKKAHKTQVNVIVGGGKQPVPVPVPAGGPAMPPPPMGGGAMPPPGMPMKPPGMKLGGKVPHMTAGSLSGMGRLQKTDIQKKKK
jgi:hypothetical protein